MATTKTQVPDKNKSKEELAYTGDSKFKKVKVNAASKENVPPQIAQKVSKKEVSEKRNSSEISGISSSNPKKLKRPKDAPVNYSSLLKLFSNLFSTNLFTFLSLF